MCSVKCVCKQFQNGRYNNYVLAIVCETEILLLAVVPYMHRVHIYSGTSLIRTPLGQKKVSLLVRCPNVYKQGVWDSQMCPVYRGVLILGVS